MQEYGNASIPNKNYVESLINRSLSNIKTDELDELLSTFIDNVSSLITDAPSGKDIFEANSEVILTLLRKNISYGNSFSKKPIFGNLTQKDALYCRMADKISRLENNQSYRSEGMRDAFLDLAGYIILWLTLDNMENRNRWNPAG